MLGEGGEGGKRPGGGWGLRYKRECTIGREERRTTPRRIINVQYIHPEKK